MRLRGSRGWFVTGMVLWIQEAWLSIKYTGEMGDGEREEPESTVGKV
jgi:hypothetical protein